jgi:hypothetical protein
LTGDGIVENQSGGGVSFADTGEGESLQSWSSKSQYNANYRQHPQGQKQPFRNFNFPQSFSLQTLQKFQRTEFHFPEF